MAFWGSSLPSGKEVSVGEEETEVTITMGSIRDAEKLKNGARVCLLCAPPGDDEWTVVASLKAGTKETTTLRLCVPAQGELRIKSSGGPMDLVGFQNTPMHMEMESMMMGDDHGQGMSKCCAEGTCSSSKGKSGGAECGKKRKAGEDDDDEEEESDEEEEEEEEESEEESEEEDEAPAKPAPKKQKQDAKPAPAAAKPAAAAASSKAAEPAAAKPKPEPEFISSKKFTGSKPGYVFKKDAKGLGYYKDRPPQARVGLAAGKKQSAADKWAEGVVKQQQWRQGPGGMKMLDKVMGKGTATPKRGAKVKVHYTGKLMNGKQFDSSVGRAPFTFRYGAGEVIKGWDTGLEGMKVGGTRELEIPHHMAYGARGAPPDIPPRSTLKFTVQLLAC